MIPFPRGLILSLVMSLLVITGAGVWFYRGQERYLRDEVERNLTTITQLKVNQISEWRKEQLADAGVLMENPFLADKIARWMADPQEPLTGEFRALFSSLQSFLHYHDILLMAPDGAVRLRLNQKGQHARSKEVLAEARRDRRPVLMEIHTDESDDIPHFTVVIPYFDGPAPDAAFVGALVLVIDAHDFLYPLIQSWPTPSVSAETLLVRREGDQVLYLNELRHQKGTALKLRRPLTQLDLPAALAVNGERGVRMGRDYRGVPVISVLEAIPDSPWFIVTKMDETEAFALWRFRSTVIVVFLVLMMALVGTAFIVFWQRNQKAHYRALYTAEALRRAEEQRYGVTLKSVGDGVIATDHKGRVELLNPVAESLTGWTNAEARGQPVGEVFRIINEQSRQPVESPVDVVLRKGVVVGLANHTVLIRRDGSERPIADSGAPIRDDQGALLGVVLVFRDQTVEREAQKAQENYQNLFQNMINGFALHAIILGQNGKPIDYRFLAVNPAFEKMTGLKAGNLIGKRVLEVMPRTEPYWIETYGRVALTGEPVFFEHFAQELNKHYEITAFCPAPLQFACIFADVTELKKTEAVLRENAAKFRQTFDLSPIGSVMVGLDKRFISINRAFSQFVGYSETELIGKSFAAITHPDDVHLGEPEMQEIASGKRFSAVVQKRYIRKDGQAVWGEVTLAVVRDEVGKPLYFLPVIQDITEKKRAEKVLHDTLQTFADTVQSIPAGLFIYQYRKPDSLILLDGNAEAQRLTGLELAQCRGREFNDLFPDAWSKGITQAYLGVMETGQLFETEDLTYQDDQIHGAFRVRAFRMPLDRLGVAFENIIEFKKAEQERIKLQEQLAQSQKIESVGRLAGGVAHDFNNMLGVILGHVEMAQLQIKPDHPMYADLEEIRKAGQRSAELTRQLLAFARKQTIAPQVLDFNETISRMLKMLQRLIGEDIELAWMPGANLNPVKIDPAQVDQILANLCVNARDAISGTGKITIETENVSIDQAAAFAHPGLRPGPHVMLAVSDNGCGMDNETLRHIFEPFFTTKAVGKGTGLGLATIYGIVKQNHGFVNVYSEPQKGSTFRIYFPSCEAESPAPPITALKETPRGQGETILLVEDEESILEMGKTMLKHLGYTVLAANSPAAALDLVREQSGSISLIITDVVMPEMNGKMLVEQIKKVQPDIKSLFMSGYTANVIAHQGVLDEGVQFLQKPFALRDLAIRVNQILKTG